MSCADVLALGLRRKVPVVLQTEAADCGLACLTMVASYHGHRADLGALRRRFSVSAKGTTLATLMDFASRLELTARAVRLELEDLERLKLPCILHWRFTHYVVLARVRARRITIHDPATGARTLSRDTAGKSFTGIALELWPTARFEHRRERRAVRLRELVGRVTGLRAALLQIGALAVVLELFVVANPLFLQWVIDHALVSGSSDLLALLAVGFGVLVVCEQAVAALRAWLVMHLEATLGVEWQANVFRHLLALPLPFFERRHLGDVVSRFRSLDAIRKTVTTAFVESLMDGFMSVALLAVMFSYHAKLACVSVAAAVLYAAGRRLAHGPLRAAGEEQIAQTAQQESHFIETVRGLRAIKLFARRDERCSAWLALLVEQVNAGLAGQKLALALRTANGLLLGLENVLVVYLGARAVLDGGFSAGMLIAFVSYRRQFSARVGALTDKAFELKLLGLHAERLAEIVLAEPERAAGAGRLLERERFGEATIEVRGLRFRYAEHEPYVLDGIDLRVAAGESVAIVGPSGCGKSTLVHLLLGVLKPTSGEILIGGLRLADLTDDAWRRLVGSVTQHDTLFAGSIADNVSFFDPAADQARIEECARLAAIHADIERFPMAYNTFVGYLGSVLSAGQQQRLLLARALYARPSILILDEATSHLDVKCELAVNSAIRALNVTRVIVAHRPQTAATADRLVTLDAGRVVRDTRLGPAGPARRIRLEAVPPIEAVQPVDPR